MIKKVAIGLFVIFASSIAGGIIAIKLNNSKVSAEVESQKPVAIGGKITGKQYMILGKGATPIADNQINFISCVDRSKCDRLISDFALMRIDANSQILSDKRLTVVFEHFKSTNQRLGDAIKSVRTNFDGDYKIDCPSKYCLIYSVGQAGKAIGAWAEVVESGNSFDLSSSNTLTSANSPE